MGIELLLKRLEGDEFDPSCERVDTAVRAIWILYRRGKWSLLNQIGITRSQFEDRFIDFDMRNITTDHGLLYQEVLVRRFLRLDTGIMDAAVKLLGMYMEATKAARRSHYEERKIA